MTSLAGHLRILIIDFPVGFVTPSKGVPFPSPRPGLTGEGKVTPKTRPPAKE